MITGLDIKYEKLHIAKDITLMIGDIIASGDTLRLCLSQVVDRFRRRGGSLRRIVFFTVGGTKAIPLMERFTQEIRQYFPAFEGFCCVFYEGIFTVYEDKGVTGINIPDIDTTGKKAGTLLALRIPSISTAWLNSSDMGGLHDNRGRQCKDLRDYCRLHPGKKAMDLLVNRAVKAKCWTEKTNKQGEKEYVLSVLSSLAVMTAVIFIMIRR